MNALNMAVKQAFGNYPEDVISPINSGAEVLGWLEEICKIIRDEASAEKPDIFRIRKLADAGSYVACEFSDGGGSQHEEMVENLAQAGIKVGGAA